MQREFTVQLPKRMAGLPVDRRGYPVPKFVEWIEGQPDFRVMSVEHLHRCIRRGVCWICGEPLGQFQCFVIGPMCCVNRVSSEPPSHRECALFAAQACPFLSRPLARRNARDLPETRQAAGIAIARNPGVTALWVTKSWGILRTATGPLFSLGPAIRVEFFAKGRRASFEEIEDSVRTGLPTLEAMALGGGPDAVRALQRQIAAFRREVPQWVA